MQSHNYYVQYSIQEGFCNAVLEAQAAGMLCIVSATEGLLENVLNKSTGWVVPKRLPTELARQIDYVVRLPIEKKKRISEAARERVLSEFNLENQREQFESFYSS